MIAERNWHPRKLRGNAINKLYTLLSLLIIFSLGGCSAAAGSVSSGTVSSSTSFPAPTELPANQQRIHTITVFAAASLTDAFLELGKEYEASQPGVKAQFSFAGSQILRTQLEQGAVADVIAFADQKNMELLITEGLVPENAPHNFATNHMTLILPKSNPGKVQNIADLARPGLKLILADSSVPAGGYARQVLNKLSLDPAYGKDFSARVLANLVSNETDVRQVVVKIELGEADVGIVYVSDAVAVRKLVTIPIPDQFNIIAQYPIAILAHSPTPDLAAEFASYVLSSDGQAILAKWGFTPAGNP